VEQRELEQWFFRITKYADELLEGLDKLPVGRKKSGRCSGTGLEERRSDRGVPRERDGGYAGDRGLHDAVDTIFGATSIQLAPEHALVKEWAKTDADLAKAVEEMVAQQKAARETGDIGNIEKHGVWTRKHAVNPFNGETLPIWVANYILADYGTGAIMSVPAHDERDFEFATKYGCRLSA